MGTTVIQQVNLLEIVKLIEKRKRISQRAMLTAIEEIVKNREEFLAIRKIILDNTNDYSRGILQELFGDSFEGEIN